MDNHSNSLQSTPLDGEPTDLRWRWIRRWGRRLTLGLSIRTVIVATPNFIFMLSHAEVDSEAGVMVNGMMARLTVMNMTPAVVCALLLWMVGIYLDRRSSAPVARWEYAVCILYMLGVAVIGRPFIARGL